MNAQEFGKQGEVYVTSCLRSAGMTVAQTGPADLVADGVVIEVKAANYLPYSDRHYLGWQFCLHREDRNGVQADVVILLCYWPILANPVAFVIPASEIGNRAKITIPRNPFRYQGLWAHWFERWETIADFVPGA